MTQQHSEDRFLAALGKRISSVRKQNRMTQEELAEKANLDRVAIAYIETGKRKPNVTSLYRIAVGLGVKVEDLVKGL
jgi:transcriptional regulator with XRE-family HTH domain